MYRHAPFPAQGHIEIKLSYYLSTRLTMVKKARR